jgi:uncharacterized membrane protein YgcG
MHSVGLLLHCCLLGFGETQQCKYSSRPFLATAVNFRSRHSFKRKKESIMKKLFLALFLGYSGIANAASNIYEVCFDDLGQCVKAASYNGFMSFLIVKSELFNAMNPDVIREFAKNGVTFQSVTDARYDSIAATQLRVSTLGTLLDEIEQMSDAEFDARISGVACYAATVTCIGGAGIAIVTAGSGIFMSAIACVGAGPTCLQATRAWNKWQKEQDKKLQESKAKEAANGGESREGGGGGGGASIGGGQGGWFGPGTSISSGGTVTITEAPPGPMPGAIGGGVGRRPILQ